MQDERLSIFCSIERRIVEVVVLDTGALYVIFGLVVIVCVFLEHLGGVLLIHIVLLLLLSIDCIYDPFYQARMKCCFEPWEQRNSNNRMHVIGWRKRSNIIKKVSISVYVRSPCFIIRIDINWTCLLILKSFVLEDAEEELRMGWKRIFYQYLQWHFLDEVL